MIGAPGITPLQHYSRDLADPIPQHSTSLHDSVAPRLRDLGFERGLAPGSFIDELALAAQWQIKRTPLREPIKLLAAIQGRDPTRAERAMHGHLMAQPAALKALQRAETQRLQA